MRLVKNTLLTLLLCLFFINQATADTNKQELQKAYTDWCQAIGTAKGNGKQVVKYYAPNAILHPTLSPKMLSTHKELTDYFDKLTQYPNIQCIPDHLTTQIHGKVGLNTGTYTFSYTEANGHAKKIPARFTFVYKKFDDQWLIVNHHSSKMP